METIDTAILERKRSGRRRGLRSGKRSGKHRGQHSRQNSRQQKLLKSTTGGDEDSSGAGNIEGTTADKTAGSTTGGDEDRQQREKRKPGRN